MGDALVFCVPGPPQACQRARVVRGIDGKSRGVTPARTRAYEEVVRLVAQGAAAAHRWQPREAARYAFSLRAYRAREVGDADNYAKSVMDALRGVAWVDDRQVTRLVVELYLDRVRPRAEVEVRVVECGR